MARQGRVKFFERNQYILWQGASRHQVLVIQQGTVVLWDERGAEAKLLDVRGAGDMLGIDQFHEGRTYPYSARSATDVLIYTFPVEEFDALVQKYPHAEEYVSAYGGARADSRSSPKRHDLHNVFLHELVADKKLPTCDEQFTVGQAARYMVITGAEAIAILDSEQRPRAILTAQSFLEWLAKNPADPQQPVRALF